MGLMYRKYMQNMARIFLTAAIASSLLFLGVAGSISNNASAYPTGTRITLQDLGVLQVASHDLYNVNRITGVDTEDEILNLTTLFNYGEENIANGGEMRNSENPVTRTIAVNLGEFYLNQIAQGKDVETAKELTIAEYMHMVEIAYHHAFHQPFPKPGEEGEEEEENELDGDLALRTLHALLPATIKLDGKEVSIMDQSIHGRILTKGELMQLSRPLSDTFDPAFSNITVFVPACNCLQTMDLFERDSSFASQFNTTYTFEEQMEELADGRYDKEDIAFEIIAAEFAEAQVD
jgi:hypothetical protein